MIVLLSEKMNFGSGVGFGFGCWGWLEIMVLLILRCLVDNKKEYLEFSGDRRVGDVYLGVL